MNEWPTRCEDVTFDMRDASYDADDPPYDGQPGDLVWHPKMEHGGHVIAEETEEREYGWVKVSVMTCECGGVDFEDHHVRLLARHKMTDEDEGSDPPWLSEC